MFVARRVLDSLEPWGYRPPAPAACRPATSSANHGVSPIHGPTVQGSNVVSWKQNGFKFRVVSDLNTEDLRDFALLITPEFPGSLEI
jgi:hypothetical protein